MKYCTILDGNSKGKKHEPNRHFLFSGCTPTLHFASFCECGWLKQKVGSKGHLKWIFIVYEWMDRWTKGKFISLNVQRGGDYPRGGLDYTEN